MPVPLTAEGAVALTRQVLTVGVTVGGPILVAALVVGLVVSLLQAVTQLQEPTLSFLPKLLVVAAALVVLGPFMLRQLMGLATWAVSGGTQGVIP
jgi:flagellar biosynthetic protein FliQ